MHRSFNIDEHLTEHGQPVFLFSKPSVSIHVYCSYINGETPSYLADDCQLIADSGRRCLRSADANALTVPRTNTRLGDRSFSVAGPKVWNSLPATLRQPDVEFGQFKRLLKTFLFCEAAAH